jgi:hypothetical protein
MDPMVRTSVFKFCAHIIVIFTRTLEEQTITGVLKMFTFVYLMKFSNSLQLHEVRFSS